jgi:hypothetical protein
MEYHRQKKQAVRMMNSQAQITGTGGGNLVYMYIRKISQEQHLPVVSSSSYKTILHL